MRISFKSVVFAAVAGLCLGCATPKQILYLQDIDEVELEKLSTQYEAVIKPDDRLSIVVSGADKSVVGPYNLTLSDMGMGGSVSTNPEQSTLSYLVDADGFIDFPILGRIHVAGMTRRQLTNYLAGEIGKDVKEPVIYINFRNYKITVLGEVKMPGTYTMESEKINVLQAIGKAGDLNLTARRDGILLLREVDGVQQHYRIDLRDSHLIDSPYYYLQQNDILYIPPSSSRVASATTATGIWSVALSSITTSLAVVSLIITTTRK